MGEGNTRREFPKQLRKSGISEKMKKKLYGNCSVCNSHLKKGEMITLLASSEKRGDSLNSSDLCVKTVSGNSVKIQGWIYRGWPDWGKALRLGQVMKMAEWNRNGEGYTDGTAGIAIQNI